MSEETKTNKINLEELDNIISPIKEEVKKITIDLDDFNYLVNIKNENVKKNVAMILKNTLNYHEGWFSDILSKLTIKIFSNLVSNELFSIQAITQPTGEAFILRWINDSDITGSYKIANGTFVCKSKKLNIDLGISVNDNPLDDIIKNINIDFVSNQIKNVIDDYLIDTAIELGKKNHTSKFIFFKNKIDDKIETEKCNNLYYNIIQNSNYVGHSSRRGRANKIIITQSIAKSLISINKINDLNENNFKSLNDGYKYLGTIKKGLIKVWLDSNYREKDYVLFIYNGNKNYDGGIVYCPFHLLVMKTINPKDFHPQLSFGIRDTIVSDIIDSEKYYAYMSVEEEE